MSIALTNSYLQNQKHNTVSEKYNVIQPSAVGEVMASHGLKLATLSTGKAKHQDKADFQRTLARYRGGEIQEGLHIDIIHDSKKLGRGVDRLLLGIYRMICTNGIFAGSNFFSFEIRHTGNTYEKLNEGIAAALAQQSKLVDAIKYLQSVELSDETQRSFAENAARLLVPENALNVKQALLHVRRQEDATPNAWTIFNRIQENAMHGGRVGYTLVSKDDNGLDVVRNMTTRVIKANTGKDAAFNQALFDMALDVAKAA